MRQEKLPSSHQRSQHIEKPLENSFDAIWHGISHNTAELLRVMHGSEFLRKTGFSIGPPCCVRVQQFLHVSPRRTESHLRPDKPGVPVPPLAQPLCAASRLTMT